MKKSNGPSSKKSPSSYEDKINFLDDGFANFAKGFKDIADEMRQKPIQMMVGLIEKYSKKIIKLREKSGMSIKDVSEKIGLPQEEIERAEKRYLETIPLTFVLLEDFYMGNKDVDWIQAVVAKINHYREEDMKFQAQKTEMKRMMDEGNWNEQKLMIIQRLQNMVYDVILPMK